MPAREPRPDSALDATAELLSLLAQGASSADLAAVPTSAPTRASALQVRAMLSAGRRREAQLEALVETAKDLASMRDPGGVLDAIVRRARTLLGTDLAYLTLHDPEREDTYMRATSGSISAAFQSVRLPLGAGLGGLVAATRKPYASANYPRDERFKHTGDIDSAVGDEGLIAIMGTPLLVGDRFVGVLFAGHRSQRSFENDEVALLGSLAALAAVSLVQARTLLEAQTTLEALSAAHETARRHVIGVERAAAAHDRFAEVVLSGGGLHDVSQTLAELLVGWVVLLDGDGRRRSAHGPLPRWACGATDEGVDGLLRHQAVADARESGRLASSGEVHAAPILASGDQLGVLIVGGTQALDDADRRTVERAAVVSALVLLFERDAATSRRQFHTDLIADLVAGRGDSADRAHAARTLGLHTDAPFVVLALRGPLANQRRTVALSAGHALGEGSIVGEHDGVVLALCGGDDPAAAAGDLAHRLRSSGPVTVAGTGPVHDVDGIGPAAIEARRTLDAMIALGHEGRGAAASDLGFAGLIVGGAPDIGAYVRNVLGPVIDYDLARGTDLLGTLDAWFAAGGSHRHAAGELHVHANTVAQRIDRITRLIGDNWSQPEAALQVQLALHLRHLMAR